MSFLEEIPSESSMTFRYINEECRISDGICIFVNDRRPFRNILEIYFVLKTQIYCREDILKYSEDRCGNGHAYHTN